MKKRTKLNIVAGLAVVMSSLMLPLNVLGAGTGETMTVDFAESTSQYGQKSIALPPKAVVTSIISDTGDASYQMNGNNAVVTVNSGTPFSNIYNPKKFSQYIYDYQTSYTNNFGSTLNYNNGGYTGTLAKSGSSYVSSGSYQPPGSTYVTGQYSSYYNDGTYSGNLSQYVYSGSYTAPSTTYISDHLGSYTSGFCDSRYGSGWGNCAPAGSYPSSVYYSQNGYSGTLYYSRYSYSQTPNYSSGNGHQRFDYSRSYYYAGNVSRPGSDTRQYRYQGYVYSSGYDTRLYRQDYSGTVYSPGYDTTYKYKVTLTYEIDNDAPDATITQTPTAWTNGAVNLALTNLKDVGAAGLKQVTLPNGVVTKQTPVNYSVTSNGTYSFVLEDNVGNKQTKTITVSNIDVQKPEGTLTQAKTGWTNESYNLTLSNLSDAGGSQLEKVKMPNGEWKTAKQGDSFTYTATQSGIYTFIIQDKAGNQTEKTVNVTNIDKTNPTGTFTYVGNPAGLLMTLNATDNASGIKSIKTPSGEIVTGTQASHRTTVSGEYEFVVTDNAGNVSILKGIAKEPDFTAVQDGINFKVKVNKNYELTPVIERTETKEVYSGTEMTYPITKNGYYTFRVNDGGIWSEPKSAMIWDYHELEAPRITITGGSEWSNRDILLNVKVESLMNQRITSVIMPNGQITTSTSFTYNVTQNGVYTFKAIDARGLTGYGSVIVENIDKKTPTIEVIAPTDWQMEDFDVKINVNNN